MMDNLPKRISPQPGLQTTFLMSSADIAIAGGAAGCGKTYALLMMPLRHINNANFGAVTFRRETPQLSAEGGIWDTSSDIYSLTGAQPLQSPRLQWTWPSGAKHSFSHLQHEKTVKSWDSSQITLLQFDELQQFSSSQFFYMLSRNRSLCGVRPYVRACCNPNPDSFLRDFLSWWINQETGYPDYSRAGKIRWMIRINNEIHWANTPKKLVKEFGKDCSPKSVTFIPGLIAENQILMKGDPGYVANLKALPEYEKKRLLHGNWFARPSIGDLFKSHYFKFIEPEDLPNCEMEIRYWDRAATVPSDSNPDPDYTVGCKMGMSTNGKIYIIDIRRNRVEPYNVEQMILHAANFDGRKCAVGLEQEPGSAGVYEINAYMRLLMQFDVQTFKKITNKLVSWKPLAAQAKAGNVHIVRAPWNDAFLAELTNVNDGTQSGHDDQADAASGAYNYLAEQLAQLNTHIATNRVHRVTSNYRQRMF